MKKNWVLIFLGMILLFAVCLRVRAFFIQPEIGEVRVNSHVIQVEVLRTPAQTQKGLSGRDSLAPNAGMLFLFPQSDRYAFWMPDMHFPLDIIYVLDDRVTEIAVLGIPQAGKEIPKYTPQYPANRVLEINAGLSRIWGIVTGTHVQVPE